MKMLPLDRSYRLAARVYGLWIWPNCLQAHLKRSSHVGKHDYTRQKSGLGSTNHGVWTSFVSPSNRAGHPSRTRTTQTCNALQQMTTGQTACNINLGCAFTLCCATTFQLYIRVVRHLRWYALGRIRGRYLAQATSLLAVVFAPLSRHLRLWQP